jgi:hypothetical protein
LADSQYVYKQSEVGFAFSTDYGETWTSGMTNEGNILAKVIDVIGINATWIRTGLLKGYDTSRVKIDLDNDTITIGLHELKVGLPDTGDDTMKFTSSANDDQLDYVFQKADELATCDMQVKGTFDTTLAFTWGIIRAERRNDVDNEGLDFVI